jgi:hypothetical protein
VFILVPFNWNWDSALTIFVVRVATVPLSTNVSKVFGDPAESLIVSVPAASEAPKVKTGLVSERIIGLALLKVFVFVNVFAWLR